MQISLKFVSKGPINNIPVLVQIVACRLIGANLNQWWLDYRRIYASVGLNDMIAKITYYRHISVFQS